MLFHGKMAYLIYLMIKNIIKNIHQKPLCQAQILIGSILMTKLEHITNKTGCPCALANLFHACIHDVLGPIGLYGETGVCIMSSNGIWH